MAYSTRRCWARMEDGGRCHGIGEGRAVVAGHPHPRVKPLQGLCSVT